MTVYRCSICGKKFRKLTTLAKHFRKEHKKALTRRIREGLRKARRQKELEQIELDSLTIPEAAQIGIDLLNLAKKWNKLTDREKVIEVVKILLKTVKKAFQED